MKNFQKKNNTYHEKIRMSNKITDIFQQKRLKTISDFNKVENWRILNINNGASAEYVSIYIP